MPRPRSSRSPSCPAARASPSRRRCSIPPTSSRPPTPCSTPGSPRDGSPDEFRAGFARAVGREHAVLVGSGSQANLLAVAAATSHLHERPLAARRRGDHARARLLRPRSTRSTSTASCRSTWTSSWTRSTRRSTRSPTRSATRTRAVVLAHCSATRSTRPGVAALCREHGLVLIEDCCDALGSTLGGRPVGTFGARGDLLVLSRPPHDDRRGRRGRGRRPDLAARARLAARVGPRLLVPARRERRLRAALRRPLRRAARRATTTSTCSRTSASTSRSPTCRPRSGSPSSTGSRASARRRRANFARLDAALAPLDGPARAAAGAAGRRPVLVRLPVHAARGRRRRSPAAAALPARAQDRQPAAARPATSPASRASRAASTAIAGPLDERRPDHRGVAVGGLLSRA